MPPYDLTMAIRNVVGIGQFQFVQRTISRLEVLVVPRPEFSDASRSEIQECLRPILHGLTAEVRILEKIAPEPSGKYRVVMSEAGAPRSGPRGRDRW